MAPASSSVIISPSPILLSGLGRPPSVSPIIWPISVFGVLIQHAPEYSGLAQLDEFPHLKDWMYKLLARDGFERGRHVPSPHIYLQLAELPEEELKRIGMERSQWVLEAMEKDAK